MAHKQSLPFFPPTWSICSSKQAYSCCFHFGSQEEPCLLPSTTLAVCWLTFLIFPLDHRLQGLQLSSPLQRSSHCRLFFFSEPFLWLPPCPYSSIHIRVNNSLYFYPINCPKIYSIKMVQRFPCSWCWSHVWLLRAGVSPWSSTTWDWISEEIERLAFMTPWPCYVDVLYSQICMLFDLVQTRIKRSTPTTMRDSSHLQF